MVSRLLSLALIPFGKLWLGWTVWGILLLWLGRHHPVVHDPTDLSPGRRHLGWIALLVFLLCFTFEPISAGG
jgi:hypothetical protein